MFRDVYQSIPTNVKNPSMYFDLVMNFVSIALRLVIFKTFWFNQKDYLNIVNFVGEKDDSDSDAVTIPKVSTWRKFWQKLKTDKFVIHCLGIFYSGCSISSWINGPSGFRIESWTVSEWWDDMLKADYMKWFKNQGYFTESAEINWIIGFLMAVGYFQRFVVKKCDL